LTRDDLESPRAFLIVWTCCFRHLERRARTCWKRFRWGTSPAGCACMTGRSCNPS
jgi:hypothetical protein